MNKNLIIKEIEMLILRITLKILMKKMGSKEQQKDLKI